MTAADSPRENGLVERAVCLIKLGFRSIKAIFPGISNDRIEIWACVAVNLSPTIGSGVRLAHAMNGRSSTFESIGNRQLLTSALIKDFTDSLQFQIQSALKSRWDIVKFDERRTQYIGPSRPIRSGARADFRVNDGVALFAKNQTLGEFRRPPGFRVVGMTSHRVIVYKGSRIFRHPKYLTRLNTNGGRKPRIKGILNGHSSSSSSIPGNTPSSCKKHERENSVDQQDWARNDIQADGRSIGRHDIFPMSTGNSAGATIFQSSAKIEFGAAGDKDDEILSGVGINRTSRGFPLQCSRARSAVKKEPDGFLIITRGKSATKSTSSWDERWKGCEWANIMVIAMGESTR